MTNCLNLAAFCDTHMNPTKRNSILCPSCRKLISRDEGSCPHCGLNHPGAWWKHTLVVGALSDPGQFVWTIIAVNILMYIVSLALNPQMPGLSLNPLTLMSPSNGSLVLLGATGTIPIAQLGRWWSLISANYLHGGIFHIGFNLLAFWQIAPLILSEYGVSRTFVLYTVSGVFGFWLSYLTGVALTIGASAAICGLIGAAIYLGKSRGGRFGQAIYRQVGGWAIGIFAFGFLIPGINNWAHGGGMAAGIAMGYVLGYRDRKPETLFHRNLARGLAGLTLVVLIWAIASSIWLRMTH
jgi:rhomboid protease GluP